MSSSETSNNNSGSSGTSGPGGGNSAGNGPGGSNVGASSNNSVSVVGGANNAAGGGGSTLSTVGSTSTVNAAVTGVAAKITHVKPQTTQLDAQTATGVGNATTTQHQHQQHQPHQHNTAITIGSNSVNVGSVNVSSSITGVSAAGAAIKVTPAGTVTTATTLGTPITINTSNAPSTTSASIRAIGAGGQSTQVRVVMPTSMMGPSMIKQLENAATGGRTQITAFPAAPVPRTISNTSITVSRPVTQTTYLPRSSVTATQMAGVTAGQRLVTPVRAAATSIGGAGGTVTGLTAAGNFVRGTAVSRNTASPGTTVISPATNTTWMTANTSGQVQLIRTIPQQSRQRIITTQGITTVGAGALGGGSTTSATAAVSGSVVAGNATATQVGVGNAAGGQVQTGAGAQQSTIQIVSSPTSVATHVSQQQQQQQTYVATLSTVLPPRQHQATLVYSSNVAAANSQAISQAQQFSPTVATAQRFAVATPLTTTTGGTAGAPRQIRPIPLGKSFSTAKLNTTSISIRAPNLPQLTPTIATSVGGGGITGVGGIGSGTIATVAGTAASNSPRSTAVTGSTASVIPTSNLSTTRIIQLQQPPSGGGQQIISSTGRLTGNVMLQPIIVNTSAGGKIGIRPPVTMAAKVQPSLTITQLGISKLPAASNATSAITSQATGTVGGGVGSGTGNASPSISAAGSGGGGGVVTATNLSTTSTSAAAAQLLSSQNIVSSTSTATVVPLAITTRGGNAGNILTGTITPIKNANGITVGKVMTQTGGSTTATVVAASSGNIIDATSSSSTTTTASASPATTNVFIHQRPSSTGGICTVAHNNIASSSASALTSVAGSGGTTVLSSTGTPTSAGTAFLTPGTIYYESVPASSVQVSTGVLSLTTSTVTSSTMSNSGANLTAITSLPFVSHGNGSSPATFTVVPSSGGRSIGQLQIPVSSAATQLTAVPVRFSTQLPVGSIANSAAAAADAIAVSQIKPHLVQSQQIIMAPGAHVGATTSQLQQHHQQQHAQTQGGSAQMVIPLQTSIKVATGTGSSGHAVAASSGTTAAVVPSFLRKRDVGEGALRAAKNLGPTLLSMSSASHSSSGAGSPVNAASVGNCYSITTGATPIGTFPLTVEALAKKERAAVGSIVSGSGGCGGATIVSSSTRSSRVVSPASSDGGSTTVSAHSSPGVDQQMQDGNLIINRMSAANDSMHFNPINELYANHPAVSMQHNLPSTSGSSRNSSLDQRQQLQGSPTSQRLNGGMGALECPPRKKSRRSTNDSQQSTQSQTSLNLPPPVSLTNPLGVQLDGSSSALSCVVGVGPGVGVGSIAAAPGTGDLLMAATTTIQTDGNSLISNNHSSNIMPPAAGNKENAKPMEYVLRRPRNCTLLNGYKQTWKATNNHFQRYSDVKPRKPNPSVIDLANQPNILAKINGWKIYHLQSQMKDLCDDENAGYEKLAEMLKSIETHEQSTDVERISDLLKGNMQRSKIIVDGVNEAQNQIMKIFEHKTHVSDIINRCASKRNFKKRDKV